MCNHARPRVSIHQTARRRHHNPAHRDELTMQRHEDDAPRFTYYTGTWPRLEALLDFRIPVRTYQNEPIVKIGLFDKEFTDQFRLGAQSGRPHHDADAVLVLLYNRGYYNCRGQRRREVCETKKDQWMVVSIEASWGRAAALKSELEVWALHLEPTRVDELGPKHHLGRRPDKDAVLCKVLAGEMPSDLHEIGLDTL